MCVCNFNPLTRIVSHESYLTGTQLRNELGARTGHVNMQDVVKEKFLRDEFAKLNIVVEVCTN
jgi:hypothetical protein